MAKILVFQHVPYEPLGVLDPLLRQHRHRIRYVNFARPQNKLPHIENYAALIVLGGPMNIGQERDYPHLEHEKEAIRQAVDRELPVLGICLGAQLLANAMGARVYPAPKKEIGWYPVTPTAEGNRDSLARHFTPSTRVFQWHGHTFDLPNGAVPLLAGDGVNGADSLNQAFRFGTSAYGLQFHLEACDSLIKRWLALPAHRKELGTDEADRKIANIHRETADYLPISSELGLNVFADFIALLPTVKKRHQMPSR